jgi:hypothetical protein
MASIKILAITIAIFVVAALLYLQSRQPLNKEHFVSGALERATWDPSKPPIAGRLYSPGSAGVPGDLNRAQPTITTPPPNGSVPLSQQRPSQTPTGGSATMPRDALAQIKDLRELDSKIVTWLDAASQRERDTPGALTGSQRQERVMLSARLNDIRDQIGAGVVTDSWKTVSEEIRHLRDANAGWGEIAPSLEAINSFGSDSGSGSVSSGSVSSGSGSVSSGSVSSGSGSVSSGSGSGSGSVSSGSGDPLLTPAQFAEFNSLFNSAIREFQGLAQPDPLQKVRLQQLQVIRQEMMDTMNTMNMNTPIDNVVSGPPIRMSSAQLFLRQMLKPDQPLPSLIDFTATNRKEENTMNSLMSFVMGPSSLGSKQMKRTLQQHYQGGPEPGPWNDRQDQFPGQFPYPEPNPEHRPRDHYDPSDTVKNTLLMCARVREAFGLKDAIALGCPTKQSHPFGITHKGEAESVMRTVCDRIRESVPTVTPEQFGCPVGEPFHQQPRVY